MVKELIELFEMILDRTKTVQGYLLFVSLLVSLLSSALFTTVGAVVFLERQRLLDLMFPLHHEHSECPEQDE